MLRALGGTLIVLGLATRLAQAQPPVILSSPDPVSAPRRASLGDPSMPPASLPAGKPSAWENAPRTSAPAVPMAPGPMAQGLPTAAPAHAPLPPTAGYTGSYTTLPRPVAEPVSVLRPGESVMPAPCADCVTPQREGHPWLDNLSLFAGMDGWKEPADLGVNGSFGYRAAVNWGLPLVADVGLGLQVGTAYNYAMNALRILPFFDGTVDRGQSFTTVGLFQRTDWGLRWGAVYDFRYDAYYDYTSTGQWRAQVGFSPNAENEVGVWAAIRDRGDTAVIGPLAVSVRPLTQWNLYWRHVWTNEIVTRIWVGFAEEHSRFSILIPGQGQVQHAVTFGTDFYVPLTDNLALFGEVHCVTPNDSGVLAASLGIAWYPGSARGTARSRFAPMLPLANNTTFALDAR